MPPIRQQPTLPAAGWFQVHGQGAIGRRLESPRLEG